MLVLAWFFRTVLLACLLAPVGAAAQTVSQNAEARLFFEEGNRLYQRAHEGPGTAEESLLRQALKSYLDSLRIVRSRNALFNAAVVLEELGRHAASFNYYTEYLSIAGLSEEERQEAHQRRDALRERVAVLQLSSSPQGATVWVDRKDLAALGSTPLEVALTPGPHALFVEQADHIAIQTTTTLELGATRTLELTLDALPPPPSAAPSLAASNETEPLRPGTPTEQPEQDLAEASARMRNAAIGTGASALASLGVALGVSIRARTLGDEQREAAEQARLSGSPADVARAERLADQTDRFNLTADLFWGTTVALGVSSITTAVLQRKRNRRRAVDVSVSASRTGGFASLRLPIGGSGRP
jgi:hypothetical protein